MSAPCDLSQLQAEPSFPRTISGRLAWSTRHQNTSQRRRIERQHTSEQVGLRPTPKRPWLGYLFEIMPPSGLYYLTQPIQNLK
jgi:hypothetical protein